MNLRKVLQYVFVAIICSITLWAIQWQFQRSDYAGLSVIFWMPSGGILLYMATHLLNRTTSIRFYALQAIGVMLVQLMVGLLVLNNDNFFSLLQGIFMLALISLFVFLNVYIAFLVQDRSPGLLFLIAPISLSILSMIYEGYKYLWIILPISLLNLLLLRRKS